MSDNIIPFRVRTAKPVEPDIGRGLAKPEGFVAVDQDPTFNHRLENSTTVNIVKLDECKTLEDVRSLVSAVASAWRDNTSKSPEYLDLLTIEASVEFPGEDDKPTVALFNFDHRVRLAICAALEDKVDSHMRDELLSALSTFSMTIRMWMFANVASSSHQLAYGGKVGIQLDFGYYGAGITLLIDGVIQTNTFFAKKIVPV
jgi:hypothetical protein